MTIKTMATQPYPAQIPGTSGLRKEVVEFSLSGYFENVVHSVFGSLEGRAVIATCTGHPEPTVVT
jgi:phosphoglucomutase